MDARFWKAAEIVIDFAEAMGYGKRTIDRYRISVRQLADYLDAEGIDLTTEAIARWVESGAWTEGTRRSKSTVAHKVLEALGSGSDTGRSHPWRNSYDSLEGWSREAVDAYVAEVEATADCARRVVEARRYSAQFLAHTGLHDASPSELTAEVVLAYADNCGSGVARAMRLRHLRGLLGHMASRGEIPSWLALLSKFRFSRRIDCLAQVDGLERGGTDPDECLAKVDGLVTLLDDAGYCEAMCDMVAHVARLMCVAMALNGVGYTPANAAAWIGSVEGSVSKKQWGFWRRSLLVFEGYVRTGRLDVPTEASDDALVDALPGWAREGVRGYLALRRREGCTEKTVMGIGNACSRFVAHADAAGVRSWAELAPEVVSDWCSSDRHATAAGRALYGSKVRGLLAYLAEEGQADAGLWLAVRTEHAPVTRVVEVLDEGQTAALDALRLAASTPSELRDAAMISLGLTMGLRASDVAALRLADIDWRRSTVSLTQQKTGEPIELPLTVAAGNAVFAYLTRGRPASTSPLVFVKNRAPYDGVSRTTCGYALKHALGPDAPGFHVLRRTFATSMLRGGAGRSEVAEALGHRTEGSTRPYLSLDEDRMRQCALPLGDLAIGGGDDGGS